MKLLLINPFEQTVKAVKSTGDLEDIYNLLDCNTIDAIGIDQQNVLYIDDCGLLKNDQRYFSINGKVLAGNGLVIGFDDEGDSIDTSLNIDDLQIEWLPKDHVEQPFINFIPFN
tara:strand:+ start:200 stop:541 length:342 start_codon:yes stop_codon:yes gene_type:complete